MSTNDIWYGVLEAGDRSSPVVRDQSIQVNSNKIWLYHHARNTFVEYSQAIVEPKLRELATGDIARDELDRAFRAARKAFAPARKIQKWDDRAPAARPAGKKDDSDIEMADDEDAAEFIDDVEDGE
jgi:hypothetical protein